MARNVVIQYRTILAAGAVEERRPTVPAFKDCRCLRTKQDQKPKTTTRKRACKVGAMVKSLLGFGNPKS